MTKFFLCVCLIATWATSASAGVSVSSPANNSTVSSPVHYVATATAPNCSKGVASMGIYTAPGQLAYVVQGAKLDTDLSLNNGTYYTDVQEWDNCGGASKTPITITVSGGNGGGGNTFWSLQTDTAGWTGLSCQLPNSRLAS